MKQRQPVTRYEEDDGYPAVSAPGLDRRGFLGVAAAGAAALGGSLLLAPEAYSRGRKRYQVRFRFHGRYEYYPCRYRVQAVLVETRSKRLASFLADAKEHQRTEAALAKVLGAKRCADVQDRKRLARLQARLARVLVRHYRKRTRRKAALPIVTLELRRVVRPPVPGGIRPPAPPPTPPRPRPRP